MPYLPASPEMAIIAKLVAKYPRRGILLYKLWEDLKESFSPLSIEMRERIIAYISDLNQPKSRHNRHQSLSTGLDDDEPVFSQLKLDINHANIDEKLKPIFHFVKKLTLTPDQITQSDVKHIYAAGWDESALLDSVFLCAVVNCMNRFTMGMGVDMAEVGHKQQKLAIVNLLSDLSCLITLAPLTSQH